MAMVDRPACLIIAYTVLGSPPRTFWAAKSAAFKLLRKRKARQVRTRRACRLQLSRWVSGAPWPPPLASARLRGVFVSLPQFCVVVKVLCAGCARRGSFESLRPLMNTEGTEWVSSCPSVLSVIPQFYAVFKLRRAGCVRCASFESLRPLSRCPHLLSAFSDSTVLRGSQDFVCGLCGAWGV